MSFSNSQQPSGQEPQSLGSSLMDYVSQKSPIMGALLGGLQGNQSPNMVQTAAPQAQSGTPQLQAPDMSQQGTSALSDSGGGNLVATLLKAAMA